MIETINAIVTIIFLPALEILTAIILTLEGDIIFINLFFVY